jgi:hypothetical protein
MPWTQNDSDRSLVNVVSNHIDQVTSMTIYNCKTALSRKVAITPTRSWGGKGVLGLVARFDVSPALMTRVCINTVLKGGPADEAGIRPGEDFLLGSERQSLVTEDIVREVLGADLTLSDSAESLPPQLL